MREFAGARVLVVGLGVSGFSAARALLSRDAKVRVTESDDSSLIRERGEELRAMGAEVETGGHDLDRLDADFAIVSPGIPLRAPVLTALRSGGPEMWSEIELAYRLAECDLLAVTGTNGKTTTTSLLAVMLAESGLPSVAAGNIGLPLIDAIDQVPAGGAIAVEVSSFQLVGIHRFRPRAACILNVAEDHTDWHGSVEGYAEAKARITQNQTPDDVLLPNEGDSIAMDIAAHTSARVAPFSTRSLPEEGIGVRGGEIVWRDRRLFGSADSPLPGEAGLEDVLAAAGTALEYGIEEKAVLRALKAFRPLPHRLEVVAEIEGVTYIDDSKATNPHATLAAVRGSSDVVLIAGGRSKGMDLSTLKNCVPAVIAVVALGEAADEIESVFSGLVPVDKARDMDAAVGLAAARSVSGGSVLLSPGCASLDMYESYAARGEHFSRAVRRLHSGDDPGGNG
jgi:UDP-N-acetylmuramoylalanine--D-glutamate ligase